MNKCTKCGSEEKYYAKGLCGPCYSKARYHSIYKKDERHQRVKRELGRKYYQANKEKILSRQRKNREEDPELYRNRVRISQAKRRKQLKEMGMDDKEMYLFGGLKNVVYERDNNSCVCCGLTRHLSLKMYGCNLSIHHIDGNGYQKTKADKNNNINNLVTLCAACHTKEHNRWKAGKKPRTLEDFLNQ